MRLLRIIPGHNVFSVNIESLVDGLKGEIKKQNTLAANAFTLNQITVDTSDEKEYTTSQQAQPGRLVGRSLPIGPP